MIITIIFIASLSILLPALAQKSPFQNAGQLRKELRTEFDNCRKQQLADRNFWGKDSCTMAWFEEHPNDDQYCCPLVEVVTFDRRVTGLLRNYQYNEPTN